MTPVLALMVAAGILLWPQRFGRHRLDVLPRLAPPPLSVRGSGSGFGFGSAWHRARRYVPGRHEPGVSAPDLLGLLEAIAPALEAGIASAAALKIAARSRSGTGDLDPLAVLANDIAAAAARGAPMGPLWQRAAGAARSAELLLLAQAWSLSEDLGVPLAQAVRTTAGLLEARIAQERRLAGAVAGARATVNLLTVLPVGGPLLALMLGIGPAELYGGSLLTKSSLVLGLCLAGVGRLWVRRMVRAVTRGPVVAC